MVKVSAPNIREEITHADGSKINVVDGVLHVHSKREVIAVYARDMWKSAVVEEESS